jgi:16S rRNA (cytosine1407-C5)-methyltransferase
MSSVARRNVPCPDDQFFESTAADGALPADWVARVRDDFANTPGVAERILESTRMPRWRGLRFHVRRGDPATTRGELTEMGVEMHDVPWSDRLAVIRHEDVEAVTASEAWRAGRVVIQSPTSVLAAIALGARGSERVLDLCAAPGGKSAAIADLAEGHIDLVANDRSRPRCHRMRALFEMLNIDAQVRTGPGERLPPRDHDAFDRVLVDAPCSGEGRFRADDDSSIGSWTAKSTRRLASTQKAILHAAIHAVRPGGVVIYATCTLGRVENEEVVARALARYGDGPTGVELDPLPDGVPAGLPLLDPPGDSDLAAAAMRRWAPNPAGEPWMRAMDGFFLARLRRRGGVPA